MKTFILLVCLNSQMIILPAKTKFVRSTRNIKVQYKDFDSDPMDKKDAYRLKDDYLSALGYINKQ